MLLYAWRDPRIKVKNNFYSTLRRESHFFSWWKIYSGRLRRSIWERRTNTMRFAEITTINRFVSILTNAHLAVVVNDRRAETLRGSTLRFSRLAWACLAQQLHAVHKVRPRGGPRRSWRWSLPPRSARGDNTCRLLSPCVERRTLITEHLYARKLPSARIEDIRMVYIARDRIRILRAWVSWRTSAIMPRYDERKRKKTRAEPSRCREET